MKKLLNLAIILFLALTLNNCVHPKPKKATRRTFKLENAVWKQKGDFHASGILVESPSNIWALGKKKPKPEQAIQPYHWENEQWNLKEARKFARRGNTGAKIPAKQIIANGGHVRILTKTGHVYQWWQSDGNWRKRAIAYPRTAQMAFGTYTKAGTTNPKLVIWHLDDEKNIYPHFFNSSNHRLQREAKEDTKTNTKFIQLAASIDGATWALGKDNYAYRWTGENKWKQAGTQKLKRIVVGNKDNVWGEGEQEIFKLERGKSLYSWRKKISTPSLKLEHLAIGKDGSAWATVKKGSDVGTYKWENDTWIKVNNQTYRSLSAYDADNVWGVLEVEKE